MKKLFCRVYDLWLSKAVHEKTDPLVRFLDFWFGSTCKYCMCTRSLVAGVGVGFVLSFRGVGVIVIGVALVALAVAMTFGERYWLCNIEGDTNESK